MKNFYYDDLEDELEEEEIRETDSEDFFVDMHSYVDDLDDVENIMSDLDDEESDIGL